MHTIVQAPDPSEPLTLSDVIAALRKEKLRPRHEAKAWGDWIHLEGSETVISIESVRGLTTTATIEHAEGEPLDTPIFRAFHSLGWIGMDNDGEFSLA